MGPLSGRSVVVTRAVDQASEFSRLLVAAGAAVVEVPTVQVLDPLDGGAAMRAALCEPFAWLVVTSGNGASRVARALGGRDLGDARLAAIGPGTADVLAAHGLLVDLVPDKFVGEGLSAAFPAGRGRVVLAQAEAARPVVADGLRGKGWTVDFVVAYRTNPAVLDPELVQRAAQADAITFTSSSTVANYLHGAGPENVPAVVVCIGPVTAATARERGLHVNAVAEPHSLDGLVAATVAALQRTD